MPCGRRLRGSEAQRLFNMYYALRAEADRLRGWEAGRLRGSEAQRLGG
jgi:hypothetical protein